MAVSSLKTGGNPNNKLERTSINITGNTVAPMNTVINIKDEIEELTLDDFNLQNEQVKYGPGMCDTSNNTLKIPALQEIQEQLIQHEQVKYGPGICDTSNNTLKIPELQEIQEQLIQNEQVKYGPGICDTSNNTLKIPELQEIQEQLIQNEQVKYGPGICDTSNNTLKKPALQEIQEQLIQHEQVKYGPGQSQLINSDAFTKVDTPEGSQAKPDKEKSESASMETHNLKSIRESLNTQQYVYGPGPMPQMIINGEPTTGPINSETNSEGDSENSGQELDGGSGQKSQSDSSTTTSDTSDTNTHVSDNETSHTFGIYEHEQVAYGPAPHTPIIVSNVKDKSDK